MKLRYIIMNVANIIEKQRWWRITHECYDGTIRPLYPWRRAAAHGHRADGVAHCRAHRIDTADESALNIPIGMVMDVLVGDPMHLGLLVGLNTEDPECVVVRIELPDASALVTMRDALLECFDGIDIEVDADAV